MTWPLLGKYQLEINKRGLHIKASGTFRVRKYKVHLGNSYRYVVYTKMKDGLNLIDPLSKVCLTRWFIKKGYSHHKPQYIESYHISLEAAEEAISKCITFMALESNKKFYKGMSYSVKMAGLTEEKLEEIYEKKINEQSIKKL